MTRALPIAAVLALCLLAAGCGGGRSAVRGRTTAAPGEPPVRPCLLSARQKRAIAATLMDIRRLHRLEAPLTRFTEKGTPAMEAVTGKVLGDIGKVELPLDTRARLLHRAKAASGLCGLCFGAFESAEPAVATRTGENACTGH
jgi:hypothetical protein